MRPIPKNAVQSHETYCSTSLPNSIKLPWREPPYILPFASHLRHSFVWANSHGPKLNPRIATSDDGISQDVRLRYIATIWSCRYRPRRRTHSEGGSRYPLPLQIMTPTLFVRYETCSLASLLVGHRRYSIRARPLQDSTSPLHYVALYTHSVTRVTTQDTLSAGGPLPPRRTPA